MRDARGEQHGVLVVPERVAVVFGVASENGKNRTLSVH